jgi:hypothetical protein
MMPLVKFGIVAVLHTYQTNVVEPLSHCSPITLHELLHKHLQKMVIQSCLNSTPETLRLLNVSHRFNILHKLFVSNSVFIPLKYPSFVCK